MPTINRVVCAVSGGVDSCVAALLLKNKGYEVQGVFMRNWDIRDEKGFCQADKDKEDAEYVCRKIGIPFLEVNFVKEYWNNVFSYLLSEYKSGFTPNPDILCNKKIKFDAFINYAFGYLKADRIATGHYARIDRQHESGFRLLRGVDKQKDQTFFLSQISNSVLGQVLFPIGDQMKSSVKQMAREAGLEYIVKKKESAGICFIGRRNFQNFIENYLESTEGNFVNIENGEIVGRHKGVHFWTVGQRCRIPGKTSPYFVAERDVVTQDILVAPGRSHPALFHQTLVTEPPHWISEPAAESLTSGPLRCEFRFQHRWPVVRCLVHRDEPGGRLRVLLEEPLYALTPGQFAVFYAGEECLGSARILSRGPSLHHLESERNKIAL